MTLLYHGTFALDDHTMGNIKGHHLAFGNKQILTDQYAFLVAFKEFKLLSCDITVDWSSFKRATWSVSDPNDVAASCVSFLTDYELDLSTLTINSFDNLCETYGSRFTQINTVQLGHTRHRWVPTEPTDRDWRTTDNDGAFHLYMFWRADDLVTKTNNCVNVNVRVRSRVLFRVLSPAAKFSVHRVRGLGPVSFESQMTSPSTDGASRLTRLEL